MRNDYKTIAFDLDGTLTQHRTKLGPENRAVLDKLAEKYRLVMVGAGAKVLGPLSVGDNAKIAAGAVVLSSIPADSTAVGIPAKVVKVAGVRVEDQLDQIHMPDPVEEEIAALHDEVATLRKKLSALEKKSKAPAKDKE